MGLKMNFFVLLFTILMLNIKSLPGAIFTPGLIAFLFMYQYWKIWRFIEKFPGARQLPKVQKVFSRDFYDNLNVLWKEYGRDKFVAWIGFERIVTVSKMNDVEAVLKSVEENYEDGNLSALWPWIGGENEFKSSGFDLKTLSEILSTDSIQNLIHSQTINVDIGKKLKTFSKQNANDHEFMDLRKTIREWTFDILTNLAVGGKIENNKELFEEAERLTSMTDNLLHSGWHQISFLRSISGFNRKFENSLEKFEDEIAKIIAENSNSKSIRQILTESHSNNVNIPKFLSTFILLGYSRISTVLTSEIIKRENSPIVYKFTSDGIALKGFFIPPGTKVLIYLNPESEEYLKLINSENSIVFPIMKKIKY